MGLEQAPDGRVIYNQLTEGSLWDTSVPINAATAESLGRLGIEKVYVCTANLLRAGIGRQLAQTIGAECERLPTVDDELNFQQYEQLARLPGRAAGFGPDRLGRLDVQHYQRLVTASKIKRTKNDLKQLPRGIMLMNYTVIVPGVGWTIERPSYPHRRGVSGWEVNRQLRFRAYGNPYLITNEVILAGTGSLYGKIVNVPFVLPVRMNAGREGEVSEQEMYEQLMAAHKNGDPAHIFPGVVAHMHPDLQEHLQVCLADDLQLHTQMSPNDFYERPTWMSDGTPYGDNGNDEWVMNVMGEAVNLKWYDYETLTPELKEKIGASCSGCAINAYEVALNKFAALPENVGGAARAGILYMGKTLHMGDKLAHEAEISETERRLLSMPMGEEKAKLIQGNYPLAARQLCRWYKERWEYAFGPGSIDRETMLRGEWKEVSELKEKFHIICAQRDFSLPWYKDPLKHDIWQVASEYADVAIVIASNMQYEGFSEQDIARMWAGEVAEGCDTRFPKMMLVVQRAMKSMGLDLAEMIVGKVALNEQHYPLLNASTQNQKGEHVVWLSRRYRVTGEPAEAKQITFAARMRQAVGGPGSQMPHLPGRLGDLGLTRMHESPFGSDGSNPVAITISGSEASATASDAMISYGGLYAGVESPTSVKLVSKQDGQEVQPDDFVIAMLGIKALDRVRAYAYVNEMKTIES